MICKERELREEEKKENGLKVNLIFYSKSKIIVFNVGNVGKDMREGYYIFAYY